MGAIIVSVMVIVIALVSFNYQDKKEAKKNIR